MKEFSGMDYIRIDIASHFGLDKELFETRIQWVHDNEGKLEQLEDDADDYFQYAATVMAYRQAQKGIPTGHLVGPDACASGPAILSCLTGCKVGATNTGCTGQQRMDVYGVCTSAMGEILGEGMSVYERKDIKLALMPHFYFSKKEPQRVFGKGTKELKAFYMATRQVCPGASGFLDIMGTMWDEEALEYSWDLPDGFVVVKKVSETVDDRIHIDTMEGEPTFTYRHEVNMAMEKGLFLAADTTHSVDGYIVRELTARCDHDKEHLQHVAGLLSDRIKHRDTGSSVTNRYEELWRRHQCLSIEASEHITWGIVNTLTVPYAVELLALVQETLSRPSFKVISIHDQFKSLPNYVDWIRQTYIDLLAELADSTVLNSILSDIAGQAIEVDKLSDDLSILIRNAEYPLA